MRKKPRKKKVKGISGKENRNMLYKKLETQDNYAKFKPILFGKR